MAEALGFKDVIDLYYRSHFMDAIAAVEIQSRLVLLFRMLKVGHRNFVQSVGTGRRRLAITW